MPNSTNVLANQSFEAWLRASGADRDWCRRNLGALREAFEANPNAPLVIPPPPEPIVRDRYEEL
jgi:hypothetical protein